MTLNLDGSMSRAKEDPNGGAESELALLGYTGQTIRYQSDGSILPFTTGFVMTDEWRRMPVSRAARSRCFST